MITGIVCFIGGIFFAAAYPTPSALIRMKVADAIAWARSKVGL